jgi:hypothetical protein
MVLGLKAVSCLSGETLAEQQVKQVSPHRRSDGEDLPPKQYRIESCLSGDGWIQASGWQRLRAGARPFEIFGPKLIKIGISNRQMVAFQPRASGWVRLLVQLTHLDAFWTLRRSTRRDC